MEHQLNLPFFDVKTRTLNGQKQIFDIIRKKFVALTPEEWVRQHFINYLVEKKQYPIGLISVEMPVMINGMPQRADIVVYNRMAKPVVVVECKAPTVILSNSTYTQAARYNLVLKAQLLVVTNGVSHFCSRIDLEKRSFTPLLEIPSFGEIE
ncbi:type I restriction enzyme HsdR N-terminal domain-containing protein [Perlabentimonas gracilis]|uniref:type I restriction enzyme HsdR N-terminal domain-containing protein n=1 Tax=Perlabentimonas gracilis TaxID=2715279 RepID=UPI00140E6C6A|nr:type I restriction enzyme HsdR N-terminal domain-containing protein [Perlabentimonas gracilis]NHB69565.1 type I restriction enzyme HsdR N-terminal domain-containing protein [Perlabentimonas gracilis]